MSLATPWMLLLLPLVALVGWLMARANRLQYEAACRLKGVAPEDRSAWLTRRDWVILAALTCVVAALARPRWNPRPFDVERRGRDLVIALDVSRSMLAADVLPHRLEMARIAIHEALPSLAGQRVALVTFSGSASVRVPLTLDHEFVRYMLERAHPNDMDTGSTSLQAAVEKISETVLTDAVGGRGDLVVFTDGEDHLSDIDRTAELLAGCDARVLIIGLGDPVRGARVPDARDDSQWMQHEGVEVISRLQGRTLERLAARGPNVTYYSAATRPFDFMSLYQQLVAGEDDDVMVGGLRQVHYTEGYAYLLALSVALWLGASSFRVPATRSLLLLALLLPGCSQRTAEHDEAAFQARFARGSELQRFAEEQAASDSFAERSLLYDAREEFLRAALLKHGDLKAARQITAITRRLRELETVIEQQRAEEKRRAAKLTELIQRLEALSRRQEGLSQRSRRILLRPTLSEEEYNLPEFSGSPDSLPPQEELRRLAPTFSTEQRAVREETADVFDRLTVQRDTLREMLTQAYGVADGPPATEVDPIVELLADAVSEQDQALTHLAPDAIRWPQANTGFHTAAGRMLQALEALRGLQPPTTDEEDDAMASRSDTRFDEDLEGLDSETQDDSTTQPVSPGDFSEALSLRSLPIPAYSPAEILAEEAANQEKRARRKAARAGAKVEKNW